MEPILPFLATTPAPPPKAFSEASPAAKPTSTPSDTGEQLLILVKHSLPDIDPRLPANEWHLSEEGRNRCAPLADRLAAYRPAVIVTSDEPKAAETGAELARRLHLMARSAPGLQEHDRREVAFLGDAAFEEAIGRFFAHPKELVLGTETARRAARRFAGAVGRILTAHPDGNVIVVAHGTVISLFVADHADVDPFDLWQRLRLPSFVVLRLATFELTAVVERVVPDAAELERPELSSPRPHEATPRRHRTERPLPQPGSGILGPRRPGGDAERQ